MNATSLKQELKNNHQLFIDFLLQLEESKILFKSNGKWSPIQNAEHISKSLLFMNLGLMTPKILIRLFFGSSHRTSISYEQTIDLYKQKLQKGAKSDKLYEPKNNYNKQSIEKTIASLIKNSKKTVELIDNFSEKELDDLQIPHPILGKITLREILYFTIYHVTHHHNLSKQLIDIPQS